jgi:large subunit ribosomal protein L23
MADAVKDKQAEAVHQGGIRLESHQVILRPLVTEKGMHRSTRDNAYAFEISRQANKDDVRRAVEELFSVKVLHVRTQNRKGKPRRSKFSSGYTKDWKKAIVKLSEEHRIEFF